MQPHGDNHSVSRPTMHVPHEHAEGNIVLQVFHIVIGIFPNRPVVKHQDHAGHYRGKKQEKSDSSHAPGEFYSQGVTLNFYGMKMQPDITGNLQNTVSRCIGVTMSEARCPYLRSGNFLGNFTEDLATFNFIHQFRYIWNLG